MNSTFLDPDGPIAQAQRTHLVYVFLLLLAVVIPVILLTPIITWRYRYRSHGSRYTPKWSFSLPLEMVIWGTPLCIVVVLSIWLWRDTNALDPYAALKSSKPPLRVDVIGYDWKWLFIYPDLKIASIGELALPENRPVSLKLTSATVMQSFLVPALGSQIYAMAGMVTHLNLQADKPGQFLGENTQYNGMGFAQQKFVAVAMSDRALKAWVHHAQTDGIAMTSKVYRNIASRTTHMKLQKLLHDSARHERPIYFKDVPKDLFARLVHVFHDDGPGSSPEAMATNVVGSLSSAAVQKK